MILSGAGWQSAIHNTDTSGKHAIHFGAQHSNTRNYGIAIRDLAIKGNSHSGDGIRFETGGWYDAGGLRASVTEFYHLKVEGHGGDGIRLGQNGKSGAGNVFRIRDSTIRANGRTGVVAVGQTNLVSVGGCSITSNGKDGIEFNHVASTNTVRESLIADNKRYGVYAFRCEEPIIAFNGFNRNGGGAIALSGDPKKSIKYTEAALIMGNLFGDNGKTAEVQREVSLYATKGSSIIFNYFYGTGQSEMIYLRDYTYDTIIHGNHFKDLTTEVKVKVKQQMQGGSTNN